MQFYHDGADFDAHPYRFTPTSHELPARAWWVRRALGLGLLGLLVVMHSCS